MTGLLSRVEGQAAFSHLKENAVSFSLRTGAGFCFGVRDNLVFHHSQSVFSDRPEDSFWGRNSWKRKYRDRWYIPTAISDGYHLSQFIGLNLERASYLTFDKPRNFWLYVLDFAVLVVTYSAGWYAAEKIILR